MGGSAPGAGASRQKQEQSRFILRILARLAVLYAGGDLLDHQGHPVSQHYIADPGESADQHGRVVRRIQERDP